MDDIGTLFERIRRGMRNRIRRAVSIHDEARVPVYELPDPLRSSNGDSVTSACEWRRKRRAEVLDLFRRHVYGRCPPPCALHISGVQEGYTALNGAAIRKEVDIRLSIGCTDHFLRVLVYLPCHAQQPVPLFLGMNFKGNHTIHSDPTIGLRPQWIRPKQKAHAVNQCPAEETRGDNSYRWPVGEILQRGYALATVYYGDVEPDFSGGWQYGIRGVPWHTKELAARQQRLRRSRFYDQASWRAAVPPWALSDDWGAIAAWSWGLSRVMDYLEIDDDIDAKRVALFGHSRLGKAALWAGAQDERFAVVISNNSGCGGAALSRRRFGETVARINRSFPHWFCMDFWDYASKEDTLPVDQHMLIALMAPRPVYIGSADEDLDADPRGEFLSARNAESVYALHGLVGLGVEDMPAIGQSVGTTVGYHIRQGRHDITGSDWSRFLDFADRHIGAVRQ